MKTKILILVLALALVLAAAGVVLANGGIELPRWVLSGGASDSAAGDIALQATLGQPVVGGVSGGNVTLRQGFWPSVAKEAPLCARYDLNQDGFIDLDDINLVLYNSIFVNEPYNPMYDLVPDGIVDIADIFEVAVHFGESCPK